MTKTAFNMMYFGWGVLTILFFFNLPESIFPFELSVGWRVGLALFCLAMFTLLVSIDYIIEQVLYEEDEDE